MSERRYAVVDVFTRTPLTGNPAAVVFDAEGMGEDVMQAVAREMNLSETVFVLPPSSPEADYRVRIFTPRAELPFAGHPTIGTAHALVSSGRISPRDAHVVQECGAGLVPVDIDDGRFTLTTPPATVSFLAPDDLSTVARALGCDVDGVVAAADVDVGITWCTVGLRSGAVVSGLQPDLRGLEEQALDVTVYGREPGPDPWVRVRSFAPRHGIPEDPVCGSGNACVAALLSATNGLPASGSYHAVQGQECGRPGEAFMEVRTDGRIRLGGDAVTVLTGSVLL